MADIAVTYNLEKKTITHGDYIRSIVKDDPSKDPVMGATINNKLVCLDYSVKKEHVIKPVYYSSKTGFNIYRHTLSFILYMAIAELYYNSRIVIGNTIADGYYFDLSIDIPINPSIITKIKTKMEEIIKRDDPFIKTEMTLADATNYFEDKAMYEKVRFLNNCDLKKVTVIECGKFSDIYTGTIASRTGDVSKFELITFNPGFILLFPSKEDFIMRRNIGPVKKLFNIFQESKAWSTILEVNNVGRFNQIIKEEGISGLIKISESLHEKKIANIADKITREKDNIWLILIAGPSSSGKTTFSKRLSTHLKINGLKPVSISVDDYFCERSDCPKDENGEYDFECLEAIDLKLLNKHLTDLKKGKKIDLPKYDFETGKRIENHRSLLLEENQLLIVEGIHCLNDKLTKSIPLTDKYKIYISALTQLSIDDHNSISTTDTRILRRLIRDNKYRNYSASETLNRFPSVIQGEKKHIFPYQESANIFFNSALVYEISLLKKYATPLLKSIEQSDDAYPEARRLLVFMDFFISVETVEMPPTSILREFLGGSSFRY